MLTESVIAFDPGWVTGVAYHQLHAGPDADRGEFGSTELADDEFDSWVDFQFSSGGIDIVVYEQFNVTRATPTSSYTNRPIEVIGKIKVYALKYGIPVQEQTRQMGKSLGTTERLRKLGWYRSYNPHATDAARHLLAYRLTEGWVPVELAV